MNLCIVEEQELNPDGTVQLRDHRADHIRDILKLKPGDHCEVGILNGPAGSAVITELDGNEVVLTLGDMSDVDVGRPRTTLVCALPRPQTLKKVLSSAATMAVATIHLIRANRVEKSYFSSPLLEPENLKTHLVEGLSQGKLTALPEVHIHRRFRPFFEDYLPHPEATEANQLRLVADADATEWLPREPIRTATDLCLAIGPEGGWVPFEVDLMRDHGFRPFRLGRWVLRVESAVVATLAQVELLRQS